MEDINLLPKDLRPKEEEKTKGPAQKSVDFVYPKKANWNKKEPEYLRKKDAGLPGALSIFKKFKIANLKTLLHHKKEEQAQKPKQTGLSVDLLKEGIALRRSPKPELIKLFIISAIIILSSVGVLLYYKARYKHIQANINGIGLEIQNLDAELADLRTKQDSLRDSDKLIQAVYVLLKNRVNWLAFLKEIESKTLKTVYYTQLEAEDLHKISITGSAQSIEDGLKQVNIFKAFSDFAQNVVLANMDIKEEKVTKDQEEVSASIIEFSFSFTVNPEWIAKNAY